MRWLLAIALLLAGCSSHPSKPSGPSDLVRTQMIAKDAMAFGGAQFLTVAPDARGQFVAVRDKLAVLVAGKFTPDQLADTLAELPSHTFMGANGAVVIGGSVVVWETRSGKVVDLYKLAYKSYVAPIGKAILEGLQRAIESS